MNYFIFDELNVTALDINGNKMNSLYQSQKGISDNKGISNYIFVVGHLNEGKDKMQDITTNLANYLKNDYKVDINYAIIFLLNLKNREMRIGTGDMLKSYITNNDANKMISNLIPYLNN